MSIQLENSTKAARPYQRSYHSFAYHILHAAGMFVTHACMQPPKQVLMKCSKEANTPLNMQLLMHCLSREHCIRQSSSHITWSKRCVMLKKRLATFSKHKAEQWVKSMHHRLQTVKSHAHHVMHLADCVRSCSSLLLRQCLSFRMPAGPKWQWYFVAFYAKFQISLKRVAISCEVLVKWGLWLCCRCATRTRRLFLLMEVMLHYFDFGLDCKCCLCCSCIIHPVIRSSSKLEVNSTCLLYCNCTMSGLPFFMSRASCKC